MGEIKQANFRIDSDTADRFRKFCDSEGMNQAQGFDHLMQVLEMDRAKAAIPERVTEIEAFEMHIKALLEAYLGGLEINASAEERIREQFKTNLESKDKAILMLQTKVEEMAKEVQYAKEAENNAAAAQAAAEKMAAQAESNAASAQAIATETKKNNEMLMGKLAEAEEKLNEYKELKAEISARDKTISDLKESVSAAQRKIEDLKKDMEMENERAQMAKERAVVEVEKGFSDQIVKYREEIAALKAQLSSANSQLEKSREQMEQLREKN